MSNQPPQASRAPFTQVARNAPCPCGSGQKYKRCCGAVQDATPGVSGGLPTNLQRPSNRRSAEEPFRRATQLLQQGRALEAVPFLQQAIRSDAEFFEAYQVLGAALLQTGRLADANAVLLQALKLRSESAAAWRDVAMTYDRYNLHELAIEAYKQALQLDPQYAEVLVRLAQLYTTYSRMEEASDCFARAADISPETVTALLYRSDASLLRGDVASAEEWARKAVARDRESGPAHGSLAGILYARGRFDEAAVSFEQALRSNPNDGRCWLGLADCRTYTVADNPILDRMRAVLQRGDLNDFDRMAIHFAMGKIYDNRGEYAHAMEQFDAANGLRARELRFDRARFEVMVDQTIRRFSRDFIAASARSGSPDKRPLFIVGMYRSGTTLVEQIVSCHPDIAAGGELTVWTPADLEVDPATGEFDAGRFQSAAAKYLSVLEKIGPSTARVTDKMPFNCFRLGAIHALFPNARMIHCRRDPIDTCLSIYANLLKSRVPFAARKDDLAFCYRQYLRIMDHWKNVLPADAMLDVQYERLIEEGEAETRRLIAFTGLAWNDSCLRPEENRRAINTASAWQARQPMYATSLQRWRHYEPWLGELRQLLPAG